MHCDKLGTAILYTNDEAATERNGLLNKVLAQSVNGWEGKCTQVISIWLAVDRCLVTLSPYATLSFTFLGKRVGDGARFDEVRLNTVVCLAMTNHSALPMTSALRLARPYPWTKSSAL